jgi:hypothetical protein
MSELELKHCLRELFEGVEAVTAHETQLLQSRCDLLLQRRELIASKAAYSLSDWKDLLLICLLQKRAILRNQDTSAIPNSVPLDPVFRAKCILLFHTKDYLSRQKWRLLWTKCVAPHPLPALNICNIRSRYRSHPEGQKVIQRIRAVNAIHDEQHRQYEELLSIQTLFLMPLSLMADAGLVPRQDVTNAFHISAILTLQHVIKALMEQEKINWPRSRFARCIATKSDLMLQLYRTYASDTNVMLQSLRRLLSKPIVVQFFSDTIAENPALFTSADLSPSSNLESQIQHLLERPLSHITRLLQALKACVPLIDEDHFLYDDTAQSIELISQVQQEVLRIKQDATLALLALDATVATSCTHLFFCNPGMSIKKLGDVDFLVPKSGFFGSSWIPATLLLCDSLLVVFRATGAAFTARHRARCKQFFSRSIQERLSKVVQSLMS